MPRKLWLLAAGHVDPFDFRRAVWVDTLHRWFDYWLQGVPNGIMNEPQVDIEDARRHVVDVRRLAAAGHGATDVFLRGTAAGAAGNLGLSSGGGDRLADVHRLAEPDRDHDDQHPDAARRPTGSCSSRRR